MAQWMGPDFRSRLIYNDFRDGHYCSVIYNVKDLREERVLPMPIYDISRDGKVALSLDFSRLHRMRPGYGYSNLPDRFANIKCPAETCIWKIDVESGTATDLLKYTDFAAFEPDASMEGASHKVNHLMISPNGKRFMVLHRWFHKGHKHTRLVTVDMDGSGMYNLSDDVFVSHCYWKNDGEILSFLRKKETGNHYYLMKDKTQEYKMLWPNLNTDGHCSYSPDGNFIITDTYPNRKRIASVYLCKEDGGEYGVSQRIARVFSPFRYDNDCRCDLHPRWNRDGSKVCIDSVHEGRRGIYEIKIPTKKTSVAIETKIPKIIHCVWLGNGKQSRIAMQSQNSWRVFAPDYEIKIWNENNFDLEGCCQYVKDAVKAKKWAFASDYIRLKVLYEYGGIYMDSDFEVLKDFSEFLQYDGFFCTESHYTVCTAIIAAKPHAEWIKDLLDEYEHLDFVKPNGKLNVMPNTKRVQAYLQKKYGYSWSNDVQKFDDGLVVFPAEYFSPLNCFTGVKKMTSNTYGIHHYDNTWKSRKDKIKKKLMQIGTRVIGEDLRAKLVCLFHSKGA